LALREHGQQQHRQGDDQRGGGERPQLNWSNEIML
jgi:hypothetical protein